MTRMAYVVLFAGLALPAPGARADVLFNVAFDTSSLMGHPAGPFTLNFQLIDGGGTGDGNNQVTLDNFAFGGGGVVGAPSLVGGASGNPADGVTLTDSAFLNEYLQGFTPGSVLRFSGRLTGAVDPGVSPDTFTFAILDGSGAELPTLGPVDVFLAAAFDGPSPALEVFRSDPNRSPFASVGPVVDAPEPASAALLVVGLVGLGLLRKRPRAGTTPAAGRRSARR